ncbi:hypothetical protein AHMF7605_12025 [Adhaeribacter arboris]|uniref:Uncharacterized protein n=1 Tax=Adhaeribacter arboris TaxID=2072846 RepID=A0A2T2YFF9_9BACT|nr:hypothetical protein [Adhaeribacter arboris]PSR54198.1 hypothetical protein AHMF7605_12025 [Adhaeribacter arboris]
MEPKTIREIMPPNFTMNLARELQVDPANVSRVVNIEKTTSKYWPAIERLAIATDSKAYRERMKFLESKRQTAKAAA